MAKRISIKLSNENDWLVSSLEEERVIQNRPSINNLIETILVSYFKERGAKSFKKKKSTKTKLPLKNGNGK